MTLKCDCRRNRQGSRCVAVRAHLTGCRRNCQWCWSTGRPPGTGYCRWRTRPRLSQPITTGYTTFLREGQSAVAQGYSFGLSTTRTRVRILCCGVKTLSEFFTLHCSSSLSCINEYLAIDSGGYVYEQPSRINCSIWLDVSQRSVDGVCVNRSVREVKCKAPWTVLTTGYCAI